VWRGRFGVVGRVFGGCDVAVPCVNREVGRSGLSRCGGSRPGGLVICDKSVSGNDGPTQQRWF